MSEYRLFFSKKAIEDIKAHKLSGQKKICEKIEKLLDEIAEHPTTGTGQIEPLKGMEISLYGLVEYIKNTNL